MIVLNTNDGKSFMINKRQEVNLSRL